jgi:transcriptional regulator of acetoin/glycerol metabolism
MTPHLDTIPGMAAAFQIGRAEYLAQIARHRLCVLTGWPSQKKQVATAYNLHLNGGGMKQLKRDAIALKLREANGNQTEAAKMLGVHRSTVRDFVRANR